MALLGWPSIHWVVLWEGTTPLASKAHMPQKPPTRVSQFPQGAKEKVPLAFMCSCSYSSGSSTVVDFLLLHPLATIGTYHHEEIVY